MSSLLKAIRIDKQELQGSSWELYARPNESADNSIKR
jgi:hypothetical protein